MNNIKVTTNITIQTNIELFLLKSIEFKIKLKLRSRKKAYYKTSYTIPNFVSLQVSDSIAQPYYTQNFFLKILFLVLEQEALSKNLLAYNYELHSHFGKLHTVFVELNMRKKNMNLYRHTNDTCIYLNRSAEGPFLGSFQLVPWAYGPNLVWGGTVFVCPTALRCYTVHIYNFVRDFVCVFINN